MRPPTHAGHAACLHALSVVSTAWIRLRVEGCMGLFCMHACMHASLDLHVCATWLA